MIFVTFYSSNKIIKIRFHTEQVKIGYHTANSQHVCKQWDKVDTDIARHISKSNKHACKHEGNEMNKYFKDIGVEVEVWFCIAYLENMKFQ